MEKKIIKQIMALYDEYDDLATSCPRPEAIERRLKIKTEIQDLFDKLNIERARIELENEWGIPATLLYGKADQRAGLRK